MIRTNTFARLVALLFALLLTGFPVAAVAQEANPATSASVASVQTGSLDLTAMTLMPSDLDEAGFAGLGLSYGGLDTLDYAAQTYAEIRGGATPENGAGYARLLRDVGWAGAYESDFASPRTDDPNEFAQRVRFVVTRYADDDGAARAFAALSDAGEITAFTVEVIPWSGEAAQTDEAVLWRYDGTRKSTGSTFHTLELHLRLANLTAALAIDDFAARPDVAAIDSLAGALLRRIETVKANSEPGLSASALRFVLPSDTPSYDNYTRLDGEDVRYYGESPAHAERRVASYPDVADIYVVYQTIAFGGPDAADDIIFRSYIYQFESEPAASAWVKEAANGAPLVDDAPTFGDESYTCTCGGADGAAQHGFAVVIRTGARVALVNLFATWDISLAAFADVAQAQTDCLANGNCLHPAPIPNSLIITTGPDNHMADRNAEAITDQVFPDTIAPEETSR